MLASLRRRRRSDSGSSLTEMMVVILVLAVVMLSISQVLASLTKNEDLQQAKVANQERVRLTMLEMAREIRSANPILPLPTYEQYQNQIDVAVGSLVQGQQYIRWRLEGETLVKEDLASAVGPVNDSRIVLRNVRNSTLGIQLFRYYKSNDSEVIGNVPADYANCTIRVRISIASDSEPGPIPFEENSDVEIRNRIPGGLGC